MYKVPEFIKKPIEERTERELELTKVILQRENNSHLSSIKKNLQFFFWVTLLSIIIIIIAFAVTEF